MKQKINITLMLFACCISTVVAEIIPADRRTDWSPGIPGGIPIITNPVANVISFGADPTGSADSTQAFDDALASLASTGGVLFMPTGSFLLSNIIVVKNSGIVVRGEGAKKTKIMSTADTAVIGASITDRGKWQSLIGGYQKGSTNVLVENGDLFTIGEFAEIEQDNDPDLMYTDPDWDQPWSKNSVGQLFEVVDVQSNNVILRRPLHYNVRSDLNPKIRPQRFVTHAGFESFYVEKLNKNGHTFFFKNAAYCWVKDVESYHTYKAHVFNETTLGCEFRDSYFHHSFTYGAGGHGYGIQLGRHCTDVLCENNIFVMLRHAMLVSVGTVGCVFGYNFSTHPVQGNGEQNLNRTWAPDDISLHGHWGQMNLFEGNVVGSIAVSDHWGPMGPGNTLLRNFLTGDPMHNQAIRIEDHSHTQNFVGNVAPWWETDGTSTNLLRHGEKIGGIIEWDPNISDKTIPASYYLKSKPAFFGNISWPTTGSDITTYDLIPAQKRYNSYHNDMKF